LRLRETERCCFCAGLRRYYLRGNVRCSLLFCCGPLAREANLRLGHGELTRLCCCPGLPCRKRTTERAAGPLGSSISLLKLRLDALKQGVQAHRPARNLNH
jgi:hypothetical protein